MNKRWFWIGYHGIVVLKLNQLRECAKTLENCLNQELSKLDSLIEEETAKLKEEEKDFCDSYSDSRWNLSEVFPGISRASLFVTCYSFLEDELNKICGLSQKEKTTSVHYSDMKGRGIERAQRYLKKIVGIVFPDRSPVWTEILRYKDLRNIIVHNGGEVGVAKDDERSKRVKDYIEKKASIHLDNQGRIQLTLDFTLGVIDAMERFFEEIFKSLKLIDLTL